MKTTIRELMIPIDSYASVNEDATLLDSVRALELSNSKPSENGPFRAVIVRDKNNEIIGKIGQIGMLKAFEPKYELAEEEIARLATIDFDHLIIQSIMQKHKLWDEGFKESLERAGKIRVKDVMNSLSDSININAKLVEAIHKLISLNVLALFVKEKGNLVGIIRLFDIYDAMVAGTNEII